MPRLAAPAKRVAAETLAVAVLAQLVRPGAPVIYAASYGGIMDMRQACHSFGAPESALFAAASVEVGRSFGLPTDMMQGTSDSKLPDAQAAWEKTLALIMPALAGADCVTQAGALLDHALSASYEQLAIDQEIVGNVQRLLKASVVDDESLAVDEIMDLPFGGHYIESEHTFRNFRHELFVPRLAERRSWVQWATDGAENAARRARSYVQELLEQSSPASGLPAARAAAVDEFVSEILESHGVSPASLLDDEAVCTPGRNL